MKKIILIACLINVMLFAKSNTEKIGDMLAFSIPAIVYGSTYYYDDAEGRYEFHEAYGTTILSTIALKYIVQAKRPDNNDRDSFPSGHTSSAISGATFLHKRYGLKKALPFYVAAIYTGYSRIHVKRHHPRDVLAGALIGGLSSWYFASKNRALSVTPMVDNNYQGLSLNYRF